MIDNWLYTVILILLVSLWFTLHRRSKSEQSSSQDPNTTVYGAVSIQACSNACEAVSEFEGKRFLATEIASVPVMGCSSKECACTLIQHQDRRSGIDRRYPHLSMLGASIENEHRKLTDRRKHSFV